MRVLSIFGTRPEAIKMAPVVRELARRNGVESVVCATAQHRQMLDQVLRVFEIEPDIDLDLMEEEQSLPSLSARAIGAVTDTLRRVRPDVVLVQGDTTTAMSAALASFYARIPVGHVEAGLRTGFRYSPFPEEANRKILSVLATYHFAPTARAVDTLRGEGIPADAIFLTGNPVVDALRWTRARPPGPGTVEFLATVGLNDVDDGTRTVLVTAHRRESLGDPLADICRAVRMIAERNPGVRIVYPVHLNPGVRRTVFGSLSNCAGVHLTDPPPYEALVHLMDRSHLILTDSGGIQEEGPVLGKPVLVLREATERIEGIDAGNAKLVGRDADVILKETEILLSDGEAYRRMATAVSPYGDGHAAERIVSAILGELSEGDGRK